MRPGSCTAVPIEPVGRALRAAVATASSVGLAIAAHTAASGMRPALPVAAGALVLLGWLGYRLADREWSLPALVAGVLVGQGLLHVAFAVSTNRHMHHPAVLPGTAMVAVHAAAALVVAALLRRGEAALWRAARLLGCTAGALLPAAPRPLAPPRQDVVATAPVRPPALIFVLLRRAVPRRGPPLVLSALSFVAR